MADIVDLARAARTGSRASRRCSGCCSATAGTLQGTLSAYFGAPVTVEVVSQRVDGDTVHRAVDLVCKERGLVACRADDRGPRRGRPRCAS